MTKTLEELRKENAERETEQAEAPQAGAVEVNVEAAQETQANDQAAQPGEDGDESGAETESWMKGDDQESQGAGEKKFTDRDVAAAKSKLRAKVEKKESEIEQLKAQLEEERRKNQAAPQVGAKPKLEDFYDKDYPEEAFAEALVEWKLNAGSAQQRAQEQQYEQQRRALDTQQRIESSVDQHYERAAKLAEASGITPELYQSADRNVREAIEAVFPNGGGEQVTNALIHNLGDGSEKVLYHLGVNRARRTELQNILRDDPTGLRAATFLGKLSAEVASPARKKSTAPAPAAQIQGDRPTTEAGRAMLKKYNDAHKSGDISGAIRLKREAKAAGVNTSTW